MDSHATYLWAFPRGSESPEQLYKIVEEQIAIVEYIKREQYRKLQKENPSTVFRFILLEHTLVNGSELSFSKWKTRLDEILLS